MADGENARATTRIEIPARTFARAAVAIVFTLIGLWLIRELATVLLLIAVSLILTAVLSGLAGRLEQHGIKHGLASMLSVLSVILVVGGLVALILPPLIRETSQLVNDLPQLTAQLRERLNGNPAVFGAIEHEAEELRSDPTSFVTNVLKVGANVLDVVLSLAMILTLSLYFMSDGDRVKRAVMRFTPAKHRDKMAETIREATRVVRAYFVGQAVISGIFATITFLSLTVLGIKYAVIIAVIAFFLDAIPNIGATLATILTVLIALPQSTTAALVILGIFLVYQQIENNMISPRVLAGRLNVPPILTLLMVLIGGRVMGIVGVFIAIPLAGLLPVIERVWIRGDVQPSRPPLSGTGRGEAAA